MYSSSPGIALPRPQLSNKSPRIRRREPMDPSSGPSRPAVDAASIAPDPSWASTTDAIAAPTTLKTTAHLARFEFSDQGTKVLMVEWHPALNAAPVSAPSSAPSPKPASALGRAAEQVSWPGKSTTTIIASRDTDEDEAENGAGPRRRIYFLLPPETPIPPTVTIARTGQSSLVVKPLPAIFPPGFDADAGVRGVLHTLWATRRLSELQHEVDAELRTNSESVGLEMALAEKQWILDNFLRVRSPAVSRQSPPTNHPRPGDRLKGLRLGTSPSELAATDAHRTTKLPSAPLSDQGFDVDVSSLNTLRNGKQHGAEPDRLGLQDGDDDLFALPLSPRSPDMKRSPFSVL